MDGSDFRARQLQHSAVDPEIEQEGDSRQHSAERDRSEDAPEPGEKHPAAPEGSRGEELLKRSQGHRPCSGCPQRSVLLPVTSPNMIGWGARRHGPNSLRPAGALLPLGPRGGLRPDRGLRTGGRPP